MTYTFAASSHRGQSPGCAKQTPRNMTMSMSLLMIQHDDDNNDVLIVNDDDSSHDNDDGADNDHHDPAHVVRSCR